MKLKDLTLTEINDMLENVETHYASLEDALQALYQIRDLAKYMSKIDVTREMIDKILEVEIG